MIGTSENQHAGAAGSREVVAGRGVANVCRSEPVTKVKLRSAGKRCAGIILVQRIRSSGIRWSEISGRKFRPSQSERLRRPVKGRVVDNDNRDLQLMTQRCRPSEKFYSELKPFGAFRSITEAGNYRPLPADWIVGVADVVQSTAAVAAGRYKAVNIVGAAVIAAVTNALPMRAFPFAFGGDGASVAVPGADVLVLSEALSKTAIWAQEVHGLVLRVAVIPVRAIRQAGFDVRVARYAVSGHVSYGMFSGGGLSWAEARLKEGDFGLEQARSGESPDLSGLLCSFSPIRARRGVILSVLAAPLTEGLRFAEVVDRLLEIGDGFSDSGRPLPPAGPKDDFVSLHAPDRSPLVARRSVRSAWSGLVRYADAAARRRRRRFLQEIAENTDFRKFDDVLRMTIDCTPEMADAIDACLAVAATDGICHAGTHRQATANLTCYVPSVDRGDHVHFVDGAEGGYAIAATRFKGVAVGGRLGELPVETGLPKHRPAAPAEPEGAAAREQT